MPSPSSSGPGTVAVRAGRFFLSLACCSLLLVSSIAAAPALGQSLGVQPGQVGDQRRLEVGAPRSADHGAHSDTGALTDDLAWLAGRFQALKAGESEPASGFDPDPTYTPVLGSGPPEMVTVGPQDSQSDIQAALDALSAGQVLRLQPGRYVGLTLALRTPGVTIEAEGAVMDGAATEIPGSALTSSGGSLTYGSLPPPLDPLPTKSHAKWAAKEAPAPELQAREVLWVCSSQDVQRERCSRYTRKPAGSALGRGEFATDGRELSVGDDGGDWSNRVLLWPQTPEAISCTAAAQGAMGGVTIRGLTVRRYAPPFHRAQVDLSACDDVLFDRVAILESSTIGLWPGADFLAKDSRFEDNGQLGVEGSIGLNRFEDSTCSRNNTRNFPSWNAGGCKFFTKDHTIQWIGGEVAENVGYGFWTDGSTRNPLIRGALIRDNSGSGVHIELTFGGLVENNILVGNGTNCGGDKAAGSAIKLQGTVDAVVRGNLVVVSTDCGRGITLRQRKAGRWETARNEIVDNTVVHVSQDPYGTNGFWIVQSGDPTIEDRVHDNLIDRNRYVLAQGDQAQRWRYQTWAPTSGGLLTWEQWQARGHDVNGRLLRVPDPAAWIAAN